MPREEFEAVNATAKAEMRELHGQGKRRHHPCACTGHYCTPPLPQGFATGGCCEGLCRVWSPPDGARTADVIALEYQDLPLQF